MYEKEIFMFYQLNRTTKLKERNYFVYKIITCPIRADILDVYSKLEKCIVVLANLTKNCVKA